jgi:hypothetical protein
MKRMENSEFCPLPEECSVYVNNIAHNEMVGLTYRNLYCLQGNKKYKSCKRYQAFMQLRKPIHRLVLPNSSLSMDEIAHCHD